MIIGGGRRFDATIKKEVTGLSPLTMYNEYPDSEIPFDDFAQLALERFAGKSNHALKSKLNKNE
jgi:hypothetical protein